MPVKDGCNNTEKNRILSLFDKGIEPEVIARGMALTERIVNNMIDYYRKGGKEEREKADGKEVRSSLDPASDKSETSDDTATDSEPKPKAKKKAKKKAKATAEEDFK